MHKDRFNLPCGHFDHQSTLKMKEINFHKAMLFKKYDKQHPFSSILSACSFLGKDTPKQTDFTDIAGTISGTMSSQGHHYKQKRDKKEMRVRVVRRKVDLTFLQKQRQQPLFDRWQGKMIHHISSQSNLQRVLKLLK